MWSEKPKEPVLGAIAVADLLKSMPADTAKKLVNKVDVNNDGYISAEELGGVFRELQKDERKIKHLRWELVLVVVFLCVSMLTNFGSTMYAVEKGRTTGTLLEPDGTAMLTDKEGHQLRVNTALFESNATLSSQLPNSHYQSLKHFLVGGSLGEMQFSVLGFTRVYATDNDPTTELVIVDTQHGEVTFDWDGNLQIPDENSGARQKLDRIGLVEAEAKPGNRKRKDIIEFSTAWMTGVFTENVFDRPEGAA